MYERILGFLGDMSVFDLILFRLQLLLSFSFYFKFFFIPLLLPLVLGIRWLLGCVF